MHFKGLAAHFKLLAASAACTKRTRMDSSVESGPSRGNVLQTLHSVSARSLHQTSFASSWNALDEWLQPDFQNRCCQCRPLLGVPCSNQTGEFRSWSVLSLGVLERGASPQRRILTVCTSDNRCDSVANFSHNRHHRLHPC